VYPRIDTLCPVNSSTISISDSAAGRPILFASNPSKPLDLAPTIVRKDAPETTRRVALSSLLGCRIFIFQTEKLLIVDIGCEPEYIRAVIRTMASSAIEPVPVAVATGTRPRLSRQWRDETGRCSGPYFCPSVVEPTPTTRLAASLIFH